MELLQDKNRDYRRYRHNVRERSFLGLQGLQSVLSSNVSSIGVKGDSLIIRFHNGSMYEYPNQATKYDDILRSNSKGKWVWRFLRKARVPYQKIGILPLPDDIGVTDEDIFQEIDNRYMADLTRHVDVPIFQSFEFIKGMSMQKILVGSIATYVPITAPLPIVSQPTPSVKLVTKPSDAIEIGKDLNIKYSSNFISNTDEQFVVKGTNEMHNFAVQYDVLKKHPVKFDLVRTLPRNVAGRFINTFKEISVNGNNETNILINNVNYNKKVGYEIIKNRELYGQRIGYTVKTPEDKAEAHTIIHEYGHHVQLNVLFYEDYIPNIQGVAKEEYQQALDYAKQGKEAYTNDIMKRLMDKMAKQHFEEIKDLYIKEQVAKGIDADVARKDFIYRQISEYGQTNEKEFFAETFSGYILNDKKDQNDAQKIFGKWLDNKLKGIKL